MVSARRTWKAGFCGLLILWLLGSPALPTPLSAANTPANSAKTAVPVSGSGSLAKSESTSGPRVATIASAEASPAMATIRIGIQPHTDDGLLKGAERERYRRLCEEIATSAREKYHQPIRLQIAVGSYADVYYWCEHDMIDMALVTAGVYSLLQERLEDRWVYLCTMSRRSGNKQFEYGVECFTPAKADVADIGAIRNAHGRGCLDLFLVDQKSVSGGIFPLSYLKGQGIPVYDKDTSERPDGPTNHVFYAGSQKECVKALCRADADAGVSHADRVRIAFVSDGVAKAALASGQSVQRLKLDGLESIRIPGSAMVVQTSFYQRHRELLDRLPFHKDFTKLPQFEEKYGQIRRWRDEVLPEPPTTSERTDWPNFFRQLETYMQEQKQLPRIALVLAGGGAKCAFQVGVI